MIEATKKLEFSLYNSPLAFTKIILNPNWCSVNPKGQKDVHT